MIKFFKYLSILLLLFFLTLVLVVSSRPDMKDVGIPYAPAASDDYHGLKLRWLGVSTVLFDDGKTKLMIDGFISRPSLVDLLLKRPIQPDVEAIKAAITAQGINRLAAIIPVHSHYDHALDTADLAKLTGADVLGLQTTAYIAASSALPMQQMKTVTPGLAYEYGEFRVTLIPSKHAPLPTNSVVSGNVDEPFALPAPYTAWKEGQSFAVHIAHPEGSVLVQGSAGFIPGSLDQFQADTILLGTGGLMDLSSDYVNEYVSETVHAVLARRAIIIHHDDLFGDFGDVEQNKLVLSFDKSFAFSLSQLVQPATLEQMAFGVDIAINSNRQPTVE